MKFAVAAIVAGLTLAALPANAEDARVGVGVGPVGAGVTVGSDRDRDHTTVIKREEPRDKTVIIKKHDEPVVHEKTIVHEHDD